MATATAAQSLEVEAKLSLGRMAAPRTRDEIGPIPGYRTVPLRAQRIRSTYLDTADRTLLRLGMSLRVRSAREGASLEAKWPASLDGAVLARRKIEVPLPGAGKVPSRLPSGPLSLHLAPYVARRRLVPLLTIDLRRERLWLFREGESRTARPLVEIALDRAVCRFPGHERAGAELREIEVRALEAEPAEIAAIARVLEDRFGLLPALQAKPLRAFAAHPDGPPPPPVADQTLGLPTPLDRAARVIVARQLRILRENDPGTRLGEDPEALHDLRVAVRRLRAFLRAFGPGVPARHRERSGEDLRWLGGLLGPVRDFDVRIARLAESRLLLPEPQRTALAPYAAHLSEEREIHRAEMLGGMDSPRYWRLLVRLEKLTEGHASGGESEPFGRVAYQSLRRLADRLAKAGKAAAKDRSDEGLHRLRIRAKRLRYVLSFLDEALGKHAQRAIRSLARLQDALGSHRDAVASAAELSRYTDETLPSLEPAVLLSIGSLIGMESARAERSLDEFDTAWKRWTSKRSRKDLADALARAGR